MSRRTTSPASSGLAIIGHGVSDARLYRVTVFGEPRAPWRETYDRAMRDAIRLKLASWDEEAREWFLPVPAEIEVFREDARFT